MSNVYHTNFSQRMISDLKCNYNTPFDRAAWYGLMEPPPASAIDTHFEPSFLEWQCGAFL
jgi:hypothetical protein